MPDRPGGESPEEYPLPRALPGEVEQASIFTRGLVHLTRISTARPWTVVFLALLTTLASLWIARGLELRTGKLDLIPRDDAKVQAYLRFGKEFGTMNRLLAVIDGENCKQAARELAASLRERPDLIRDATARLEMSDYVAQYLHTLPYDEVRRIRQEVQDARLDLQALGRDPQLATILHRASRRGRLQDAPDLEDLEHLRMLVRFLLGEDVEPLAWIPGATRSDRGLPPFVAEDGSFLSKTRRKALVVISPRTAADRDETRRPLIRLVRDQIREVEGRLGVEVRLTGEPALKEDEAQAAARSLVASSLASLSSVLALFLFAFRRRSLPLLGVVCLVLSIFWTLAWARITVHYMTIVSTSFTAILIGLGVDFAIHLISRFEERSRICDSPREALIQAADEVASGVLTGALTTSAAFFSMLLVGFPAFQGLGVIAGGGILLAVLETFTLLPAVILLRTRDEPYPIADEPCPGEGFFRWMANRIMGSPSVGVMMALAICVVCLGPASRLRFDTNLLRMNDPEAESMQLQDLFLHDFGFSPAQNAITYESPANMVQGVRRLREESPIGLVESLAPLLPTEPGRNQPEIEQIQTLLEQIPPLPEEVHPDPRARSQAAERLAEGVSQLRLLYLARKQPAAAMAAHLLHGDLVRLQAGGPGIEERERQVLDALRDYLTDLRASSGSPPNLPIHLDPEILERFRPADRYAVFLAPSLDVRQDEEAQRFTRLTERVAEETGGEPTGLVVLTRHVVSMLENGYAETCLYSALAVAILLFLDLRRLDLTLVALGVCGMGILALRASLTFHGVPLNAANFIAIPLLLGVGVDNAVHVLHPWMRGVPLEEVLGCTGRPITMNALTSTLGFGGLLFADHQGLYSLGWAMAVGVLWCLVATFLLLPGILSLFDKSQEYWERVRGDLISRRFH